MIFHNLTLIHCWLLLTGKIIGIMEIKPNETISNQVFGAVLRTPQDEDRLEIDFLHMSNENIYWEILEFKGSNIS